MPITYITIDRGVNNEILSGSNLLNSPVAAYVNTVNCEGYMGKGLALDFKNKYPDMYETYQTLCLNKLLEPGKIWTHKLQDNKYVINVATKKYARDNSELSWIESIAIGLPLTFRKYNIHTVAMPGLGCGEGKLSWRSVGPLLNSYLSISGVNIYIYIEKDWVKYRVIGE